MRKVQGISFPRSGHHLLIRDLQNYFTPRIGPASDGFYGRINKISDALSLMSKPFRKVRQQYGAHKKDAFFYCEYYTHCNSIPCVNPRVNFQKNHDFQLDVPRTNQQFYLVQIREPLPAIISWFELELNHKFPHVKPDEYVSDSKESWYKFFAEKLEFYSRFLEKWVHPGERENLIIIDYDDYILNRLACLKKALRFIAPDEEIDTERLQGSIEAPKMMRATESFRYLDNVFSKEAESLASTVKAVKKDAL